MPKRPKASHVKKWTRRPVPPPLSALDAEFVYNQHEAATFLRISPRTLEWWRVQGRGPRFVRGAALLGILLMNVLIFGLPFAAYANPNLWGGNDPINLGALAVQYVLFDGKMRALFSIMFGAGIVLFVRRALERENSVRVADLFSRRMLWMILFGALHGWLIWAGDILYAYGLFGLLVFPLRNVSPRRLFIIAGVALLLLSLAGIGQGFSRRSTRDAALAARAAEAQGQPLTKEQQDAKKAWDEAYNAAVPSKETLQEEVDNYRGGYLSVLKQRVPIMRKFNFVPVYFPGAFDIWALMLIGMALFKLDVLQGGRSHGFYLRLAVAGYAIGIPVNAVSTYGLITSNFDIVASLFWTAPYQVGRVSVALAHASVLILLVKGARMRWLTGRLAAVGQMAFSNYISHSIICALIFYTPGLGLIGQLQRYQLYFVVLGVWTFNLTCSPIWLRHFRFGPLEWCWRSLTYWQRQPMVRRAVAREEAVAAS